MLSISEHRCVFHEDKLEDTKWVIKNRKSKKDRRHNGQKDKQ